LTFAEDDIWSVRKVCFEKVHQIIPIIEEPEKVVKMLDLLR
jgi:hypothetical protein